MIGGFGSIGGTAIAAVVVGLVQQFANYYVGPASVTCPWCCCWGSSCSRARAGSPGASHEAGGDPLTILVALAFVPKLAIDLPYVFNGPLNTPGTLQLLALCLVFGGLALSYDLLFGFTGLMSFGHALYFAIGVYVAAIAMTRWHWGFWPSVGATALVGFVFAVLLGVVSLRVAGIAFAMVTLAFAQAGSILAFKNPYKWTGGEEGFGVDYHKLPAWTVGILNTSHLYWIALAYAASVFVIVQWAVSSSPGHVWQAIRENELRAQVLGLRPFVFKLMSYVLASLLATVDGVVYLVLLGGADDRR